MTARTQLLRFLRDPAGLASAADDPAIWRASLEQFAIPRILEIGADSLRPAQEAAWRGLSDRRVGLVLGPPGTGKTHLLAWMILGYVHARQQAGLPCRVFVSAFTRNAIGNLLDAISARRNEAWPGGPEVWFLGNPPESELSADVQVEPTLFGAGLNSALNLLNAPTVVVGGSVWSLYRILESARAAGADGLTAEVFDLVCIDEASQMVLSHGLLALAGLRNGGRVVVVGDDRQLPPIRAGREVVVDGRALGGSLYGFLSGHAPEFALEETFRLNAPLVAFPEESFYPGAYRSAETVAEARLRLRPDWPEGLADWERVVLDPALPVCVLLHEGPSAATSNPFEAQVAARLAALLSERIEEADALWSKRLAIISPHRAQNAAIRSLLPQALRAGAFVDTIDRIQGKERDSVILSYAVADAEFALAEAEFIFGSERLNVAVTRARRKLIVLLSRRLLEAVPNDQEVMDKAELLREFVMDCDVVGERELPDGQGGRVRTEIRARGFETRELAEAAPAEASHASEALTTAQLALLAAVEAVALANPRGGATVRALAQRLARRDDLLPDLAGLHRAGRISLSEPRPRFWVARPLDPPRTVYAADLDTVRARIGQVLTECRSGPAAPFYWRVRDRFGWMDDSGADLLLPLLQRLIEEGAVQLIDGDRGLTVDASVDFGPPPEEPSEPVPELSDADFEVLNALEAEEARRINFGVFELWTSPAGLADEMGRPRADVSQALSKLAADGWVMLGGESRVRSRMAELARELRYAKQRFAADDAARRPYVARSVKVELRDRDKPRRDLPIADELARVAATAPPEEQQALVALSASLRSLWQPPAGMAAFQIRGLQQILAGWRGEGPGTLVVAADTGSGKTEAAVLPLIVAAAADRLRGLRGVRAVLTYPRIRLAANQAQRLVGYLSRLAEEPGMPTVTAGVQFTQVPTAYEWADEAAGWRRLAAGVWSFPLFGCPRCGQGLLVYEAAGADGADALRCGDCGWRYDGWVGTKAGLARTPPNLFLPTTDSLHQWLHNPRYGALFGDDPDWAPPRALLADEIHLYSHVHGAQVGYALRRLAARAERNAGAGRPLLAIGMSATLGDPAEAWGKLIGRREVKLVAPDPDPAAREREPNPRGREYFYFIQPEAESRGQDVAGASTAVQSFMCLAHGMRRRTAGRGGYRGLVFLDSIDKVRRLHGAYQDAEEIKRLAAFRTRYYPDDPVTGAPRQVCCGEPQGCDVFRDGECWWFAANDRRQVGAGGLRRPDWPLAVADQPVTSATTGRVETLIRESDVVFATSSLEVGYDDPDISLVYQQYAPANLASFIQRKGRGGRGVDDRPITGVTLSLYSPRDAWYFRRPKEMVDPAGFQTPLNPDNHFVRRGQVLAAALDGLARYERRDGRAFASSGRIAPAALAEAEQLVRAVFGGEAWREFDGKETLGDLLDEALRRARGYGPLDSPERVRAAVDWIPNFLFDTINLPQLRVITPDDGPETNRREDVALVLGAGAPGNVTRRFDPRAAHWRAPVQGRGPWFHAADYRESQRARPFTEADELLARLPRTVRPVLVGLSPDVVRPLTLRLDRLGVMLGSGWTSDWAVRPDGSAVVLTDDAAADDRRVEHDSRSSLRGFPIVKPDLDRAVVITASGLGWASSVRCFVGESLGGRTTGLAMARLYWGADAELKMKDRKLDPAVFTQLFIDPEAGTPMLHGYHVQTEGIQVTVDADRLAAFAAAERQRLTGAPTERRWHAGQLLRFKVEEAAQALGVNMFEARRGADLLITAAADPEFRQRLLQLIDFWSADDLLTLLNDVRTRRLAQHPLLTPSRVDSVAKTLSDRAFQDVFREAIGAAEDPVQFEAWLKTCVLHSLAARLKTLFVQLGRGDHRQVVAHVALPTQFGGEGETVITVCEAGAFGDGTTRAFVEALAAADPEWVRAFVGECPNAEEDALVRRAMAQQAYHARWRDLDPNDPEALSGLTRDLGLHSDQPLPAALLAILFGAERLGAERFQLYDIAQTISEIEARLVQHMGRELSAWELASAVTAWAKDHPASAPGRLLATYEALQDASQEGSLSGESRLADQVYRLGARLCVDGCQACVHHDSDLMSESMAEASTSRRLLTRFLATEGPH